VAFYKPMTAPEHLPPKETGRETRSQDFKARVDDLRDHQELAKDVAAFANAFGGVILVGACEDQKTRVVSHYKVMTASEAEELKRAFEMAVRNLCLPQPVVDVVRIDAEERAGVPGYVVAVNVDPMPMGPVGVRWRDPDSYAFPLRTATQTHFMSPTELPMYMVPEIRRVAILLEAIPLEDRDQVYLHSYWGDGATRTVVATYLGLDSILTAARFCMDKMRPRESTVPLDCISTVWRSASHWTLGVRGTIEERPGEFFLFFPT
jgi:hypothetical protein